MSASSSSSSQLRLRVYKWPGAPGFPLRKCQAGDASSMEFWMLFTSPHSYCILPYLWTWTSPPTSRRLQHDPSEPTEAGSGGLSRDPARPSQAQFSSRSQTLALLPHGTTLALGFRLPHAGGSERAGCQRWSIWEGKEGWESPHSRFAFLILKMGQLVTHTAQARVRTHETVHPMFSRA